MLRWLVVGPFGQKVLIPVQSKLEAIPGSSAMEFRVWAQGPLWKLDEKACLVVSNVSFLPTRMWSLSIFFFGVK